MNKNTARSAPLLLLSLLFALPSCSNKFASICDKEQECSGGNDADVNACVAEGDAAGRIAVAYDCADQFDKLVDCVEAKGTCKNGHFNAECNQEGDALEKCEEAASANDAKAFSVGSAACSTYSVEAKKCCDKVTDGAAKAACNSAVDQAIVTANDDVCQAALDALGANPLCK